MKERAARDLSSAYIKLCVRTYGLQKPSYFSVITLQIPLIAACFHLEHERLLN